MNPQIREAAEELYEKVAAVHLQHTAIDILASHIALAERRGGEAAMEYVRKYIYDYSDKDLELYRAALDEMGKEAPVDVSRMDKML